MNAGDMLHRVYILKHTDTTTAKGDRVRVYDIVPPSMDIPPDDWAAISPLKGRELMFARQLRADISYSIRMRYRVDVTTGSRLGWVESEEPMRYRIFELGPSINVDLRGVDMWFYAYEII